MNQSLIFVVTEDCMTRLFTFFLILAISISSQAGEPVEGLWAGPSALVNVKVIDNSLTMTIVGLLDPFDENGQPVTDAENPESSLRGRPILGMNLLSEFRKAGDRWEGKIYDPESGNIYAARVRVKNELLEMRGYIGTPIFGRTEKYRPASTCDDDIRQMLQNATIAAVCAD